MINPHLFILYINCEQGSMLHTTVCNVLYKQYKKKVKHVAGMRYSFLLFLILKSSNNIGIEVLIPGSRWGLSQV